MKRDDTATAVDVNYAPGATDGVNLITFILYNFTGFRHHKLPMDTFISHRLCAQFIDEQYSCKVSVLLIPYFMCVHFTKVPVWGALQFQSYKLEFQICWETFKKDQNCVGNTVDETCFGKRKSDFTW